MKNPPETEMLKQRAGAPETEKEPLFPCGDTGGEIYFIIPKICVRGKVFASFFIYNKGIFQKFSTACKKQGENKTQRRFLGVENSTGTTSCVTVASRKKPCRFYQICG